MKKSINGRATTQSSIRERAYQILKAKGPMRGSDLGWELWGETTEVPDRGTGSHQHNKFCRPAGKLLKALERQGRRQHFTRNLHCLAGSLTVA